MKEGPQSIIVDDRARVASASSGGRRFGERAPHHTGGGLSSRLASAPERPSGLLLGAVGTALLQGFSAGAGFVVSIILAHALGRTGYGVYALSMAWASLLSIPGIVGFDRYLVRGLAVYESRGQWPLMRGLLIRANQVVAGASLLLGAGAAAGAALLAPRELRVPFAISMLLVPLTNLALVRQAAMQALHRVVRGQVPEFFLRPALLLAALGCAVLLASSGLTPAAAAALNVAAVAAACAVGTTWLRRVLPTPVRTGPSRYETRRWLHSAVPMMMLSGVWAANSYAAIIIVGLVDGPRDAGVFSVAEKGAALVALVLTATNLPLAPAIARLHAAGDRSGLQRVTMRMARVGLLASLPIVLTLAIAPDAFLNLYGKSFGVGRIPLVILAVGQFVNAAAGVAGNVLMMTGNERVALKGVAAGMAVNVVLGAALVPLLGITGAAIGSTTSIVVWNLTLLWLVRRRLGINASALGRPAVR